MSQHKTDSQVVIIGGGIAGGSLAFALASAGLDVLVLEATERFSDRVRGESMMPWGVREAQQLGVEAILLAAGAHTAGLWRRYGESGAPRDIPVGKMIAGVAGSLNLHHPTACQALLDASVNAAATVKRGVTDLEVVSGERPLVKYRVEGIEHGASADIVVGADGRGSVVRRAVGISLESQEADGYIAGLLLEGVSETIQHDAVCDHDLGIFLLIRQGQGRSRAYHVVPPVFRTRYSGGNGAEQFLRDAVAVGGPVGEAVASARVAGPCGAVAGTDSWTATPYVDGVVLIGDAAGHNDPTVGCGLSIAMRDARLVRDLIISGARRSIDFESYGTERMERMRRLRNLADVVNLGCVVAGPDRAQRRKRLSAGVSEMHPALFPMIVGMYVGPEMIPAELSDGTAAQHFLQTA